MKSLLKNIFYSFPIQLFILHFRKYQVLLVQWYLLGSTINSGFMKNYGADALFLSPEYLGKVNTLSASIVGVAFGVFIMSWNVTTFILHSKRCKFLATTSNPFLKYCINNAVLPLLFLIYYFTRIIPFDAHKELMATADIIVVMAGILGGVILTLLVSFGFFFGAERQIQRTLTPMMAASQHLRKPGYPKHESTEDKFGMKVSFFLTDGLRFKKVRNVSHYSQNFLDLVFSRHHFSGMLSILLAFTFLILVGFNTDHRIFQVPAAASIFIFFSITIAVIGALTYLLQSWSLPFIIVLVFALDGLYQKGIIDPRNKAYGLNYATNIERPKYNKASLQQLCVPENRTADSLHMIGILEKWKLRQAAPKPVMLFINVSGGGLRSATFVMNMLQQLDQVTQGQMMNHTMLISGASGGMLAAAYYRELYRKKVSGDSGINLQDAVYTHNIASDLLNPVFSSMIARDIFAPSQKFSVNENQYVKDRGYAFEEKLLQNTRGLLNTQLSDYTADEAAAKIPLMIFNSTITRDGRQMMISTQPIRFLMKPIVTSSDTSISPDAVDFASFFYRQSPMNLRLLTALRMNATFPYVLPNVWLPTTPVIDVMDAGLRDNFGQEISLRFIDNFKDWIKANTGGVIMLQLRDRKTDNWQQPFETGSITDILVKPATMLQHNWYKLQDYSETDQYGYLQSTLDSNLHRIVFMYVPELDDLGAALNFHLTASEKKSVIASYHNAYNQARMQQLVKWLK